LSKLVAGSKFLNVVVLYVIKLCRAELVLVFICLCLDGPRPSQTDIVELRFLMLEYVRQLVLRGSGVQDDELQSIVNFLTTIHEVCCCTL